MAATSEGVQKMPEVRPLIETALTALFSKTTIIYKVKRKSRQIFAHTWKFCQVQRVLYIEFLRIAYNGGSLQNCLFSANGGRVV